jgi:hypothetical protein
MGTGTAAKYSNGDRTRCRTRVRTRPFPRRQGLQIPGPREEFRAAEQEECFPFSPVLVGPHLPRRLCAACWICSFTTDFAADAGGQCGLVLSVVAGIAPVLVDQMGAGARSRPARRRPGLTARAAAPVLAAASSSSGRGLLRAVAHVGAARVRRQARRSAHGGAWRRADPVRRVPLDAAVGGQLMACRFTAGSAHRNRTGLRLACPRTALRSAWPQVSDT